MEWEPISESDLWDLINRDLDKMTIAQRRLWDRIQVSPQKWQLHPWGDCGGGFWIVGILGSTVVWYNDIEDGFNRSHYSQHGIIRDYWCNQDELRWTIQMLLNEITTGQPSGGYAGPPQACEFDPA
jgi:hypothetical protein